MCSCIFYLFFPVNILAHLWNICVNLINGARIMITIMWATMMISQRLCLMKWNSLAGVNKCECALSLPLNDKSYGSTWTFCKIFSLELIWKASEDYQIFMGIFFFFHNTKSLLNYRQLFVNTRPRYTKIKNVVGANIVSRRRILVYRIISAGMLLYALVMPSCHYDWLDWF